MEAGRRQQQGGWRWELMYLAVVAGAGEQQGAVKAALGVIGVDADDAAEAVDGLCQVALLVRLPRQLPPYSRVLHSLTQLLSANSSAGISCPVPVPEGNEAREQRVGTRAR